MKSGEIRQLSDGELIQKIRNAEEDLFRLRFQKHTGRLSNTAQLKAKKTDLARMRTELTARGHKTQAEPAAQE